MRACFLLVVVAAAYAAVAQAISVASTVDYLQQTRRGGGAGAGFPKVSKGAYLEQRACRRLHDTSKHLDTMWHTTVYDGLYTAEVASVFC